jgi:hypothetical protein
VGVGRARVAVAVRAGSVPTGVPSSRKPRETVGAGVSVAVGVGLGPGVGEGLAVAVGADVDEGEGRGDPPVGAGGAHPVRISPRAKAPSKTLSIKARSGFMPLLYLMEGLGDRRSS